MRILTKQKDRPASREALLPRLYELVGATPDATHIVLTRAEYEEFKMVVAVPEGARWPTTFTGLPILLEP